MEGRRKPRPEYLTPREAEEWLRRIEFDRERSNTTVTDYRNIVYRALIPQFGADTPVNAVMTADIDAFREQQLADEQ